LKDFTATRSLNLGYLNWTIWQEWNTLSYFIEKSADSIHFDKIGFVAAQGFVDSTVTYHFTDPDLFTGNNYYRIVWHSRDFDSLISPVRTIFYTKDTVPIITTISVYPNPTTGDLTIKTPSQCREIQIFDVLGRKLMDKAVQGNVQELNIAPFTPGVYFLKLFTDSGNKLIKLQKR
jgi:hypothetical protein